MIICEKCRGSGVDPDAGPVKPGNEFTPCPICGGNGQLSDPENIDATIPTSTGDEEVTA